MESRFTGVGQSTKESVVVGYVRCRENKLSKRRYAAFYALLRDAGIGLNTIDRCKTVLCSLFNTAVNDRVVGHHPCRGVAAPAVVQAPLKILTPAEYARLHVHLRDDYARLMADVLLESGCRWGEFAELRAGDLDPAACTITIARTVIEVDPKYCAAGESGFRVKAYPKNRQWRRVALSRELTDRLITLLSGRGREALMFPAVGRQTGRTKDGRLPGEGESLTFKVSGRTGRCMRIRRVRAGASSAGRRSPPTGPRGVGRAGDRPPKAAVPEAVQQVRHMRRDWFRHRVFQPAVEAAGLDWRPRVHDLRHASASRALAGGATVQQVREHLGHISPRAVERYLHNLPGAEAGAADAIARVKATGALSPMITPSYTPAPASPEPDTSVPPPETLEHTPDAEPAPRQQPVLLTVTAMPSQPQTRANEASQPSETPLVLELTITVHERTTASTANASAAICILDRNTPENTENAPTIDEPDADESAPADDTTTPPDNHSTDAASPPDRQPIVPAQRGQRHPDTRPHQRPKNHRHERRRPGGP